MIYLKTIMMKRVYLDIVMSIMAQANLPFSFWGDALLFTTYIINCVSSKSVPSTPYEIWKSEMPDLSIICLWGCLAYIHNNFHEYEKLGHRGRNVSS